MTASGYLLEPRFEPQMKGNFCACTSLSQHKSLTQLPKWLHWWVPTLELKWHSIVHKCELDCNTFSASKDDRFVVFLTLWHGSSTDISRHTATFEVCWMVAGHDLYLVTRKVVQAGDDCWLLWKHLALHLKRQKQDQITPIKYSANLNLNSNQIIFTKVTFYSHFYRLQRIPVFTILYFAFSQLEHHQSALMYVEKSTDIWQKMCKVFQTFDPSSSSSSSPGLAVVEPNGRLGTVVRKRVFWVAFATPTERLRRDGLQKQRNSWMSHLDHISQTHSVDWWMTT